jgi:hypothetical protein
VHLVVLNDTPLRSDYAGNVAGTQLTWLRADLTRARANRARVPFIIAVHHKPCFASSRHSSTIDTVFVRRTWAPVFDEFGVDLVLNGHEHDFELSKELDGRARRSAAAAARATSSPRARAQLYELQDGAPPLVVGLLRERVNFLRGARHHDPTGGHAPPPRRHHHRPRRVSLTPRTP